MHLAPGPWWVWNPGPAFIRDRGFDLGGLALRLEVLVRLGLPDVEVQPTQELTVPVSRGSNLAWQAREPAGEEGPQQQF